MGRIVDKLIAEFSGKTAFTQITIEKEFMKVIINVFTRG